MSKYQVTKDKKNELLGRRELVANAEFEKTPTKEEVIELLSKELKVEKELCVLESIKGNFGTPIFTIILKIYDNEESKNLIEKRNKKKKSGGKK
ncbi:hypothetical protein COU61_01165 [Candidatus Pacearchaeota archaeon CG10_big_fil_rev_8_21_14_0_10_35_13]|nr:MAG: hypothetical protein COU61_01165 [Candidatus Pacearchaeota archaeon CG10_big_fil_rev_8_21_14_0_10_35_13]